jgi:hypothetical protein
MVGSVRGLVNLVRLIPNHPCGIFPLLHRSRIVRPLCDLCPIPRTRKGHDLAFRQLRWTALRRHLDSSSGGSFARPLYHLSVSPERS